jgi:hypothetical protein
MLKTHEEWEDQYSHPCLLLAKMNCGLSERFKFFCCKKEENKQKEQKATLAGQGLGLCIKIPFLLLIPLSKFKSN